MRPEDPIRRLRDVDPASPERVGGAARGPKAQATLDHILGAETNEPTGRPPRRAPLALAAGVVALAIAVSTIVADRSDDAGIRTTSVVLSRAAEVAAAAPLAAPAPGEYLYQRTDLIERVSTQAGEGSWTALVPVRREVWIAADGSGRVRETPGTPSFPGPRDRALWRMAGEPRIRGPILDRRVRPGALTPAVGLPTDPEALAATLARRAAPSDLAPNLRLFIACADLLSEPLVDPALRSALYRVVAGIDGVEILGEVLDPQGRPGIGVAVTSRVFGVLEQRVLIFDGATSRVLAEKVVLLERVEWMDAQPPIATEYRAYGTTGLVPSLRARPSARRTGRGASVGGHASAFRYPKMNARATSPARFSHPNLESMFPT